MEVAERFEGLAAPIPVKHRVGLEVSELEAEFARLTGANEDAALAEEIRHIASVRRKKKEKKRKKGIREERGSSAASLSPLQPWVARAADSDIHVTFLSSTQQRRWRRSLTFCFFLSPHLPFSFNYSLILCLSLCLSLFKGIFPRVSHHVPVLPD